MRMINSKAELVELWLCRSFIPTFHFTYGGEERFHQTLRSGYLKPAAEVGRLGMFGLDILAGDDGYVFTSAFRTPMGIPGRRNCGFVFDAADLLARGAVYRDHDLLSDYEKAIERLMGAVGWFYSGNDRFSVPSALRQHFDPDLMRDIFSMGGEERWPGGPRRPLLTTLVPDMKAALAAVQALHQTEGQTAVDKLYAWVRPLCENMNKLLDAAQRATTTPEFQSCLAWQTAYGYKNRPDWSPRLDCVNAVSTLFEKHEKHQTMGHLIAEMNVTVRNPEIIWRGRLPLDLAYAAFRWEHGGLRWPEDVLWLV